MTRAAPLREAETLGVLSAALAEVENDALRDYLQDQIAAAVRRGEAEAALALLLCLTGAERPS